MALRDFIASTSIAQGLGLDSLLKDGGIAEQKQKEGHRAGLPIVLVPGFLSSCLRAVHTDDPEYRSERVWCNLELLGTKAGIGLGTILGTEDPKQKAKSAPRITPAGPPPITPATPLPKSCVALSRMQSGEWLRVWTQFEPGRRLMWLYDINQQPPPPIDCLRADASVQAGFVDSESIIRNLPYGWRAYTIYSAEKHLCLALPSDTETRAHLVEWMQFMLAAYPFPHSSSAAIDQRYALLHSIVKSPQKGPPSPSPASPSPASSSALPHSNSAPNLLASLPPSEQLDGGQDETPAELMSALSALRASVSSPHDAPLKPKSIITQGEDASLAMRSADNNVPPKAPLQHYASAPLLGVPQLGSIIYQQPAYPPNVAQQQLSYSSIPHMGYPAAAAKAAPPPQPVMVSQPLLKAPPSPTPPPSVQSSAPVYPQPMQMPPQQFYSSPQYPSYNPAAYASAFPSPAPPPQQQQPGTYAPYAPLNSTHLPFMAKPAAPSAYGQLPSPFPQAGRPLAYSTPAALGSPVVAPPNYVPFAPTNSPYNPAVLKPQPRSPFPVPNTAYTLPVYAVQPPVAQMHAPPNTLALQSSTGSLSSAVSIMTPSPQAEGAEKQSREQRWLRHMMLEKDGCSDPPGIRLRPVPGIEGCDYLCKDIPSLSHFTFVFGPLVEQLKKVGYNERTLAAMPYDWRVPPHRLEQRDEYFSYMRALIESMRIANSRRVVLVVHSMGNKVVWYFLRWMASKPGGRDWISLNIDSWFALGAPWLGAPKSLRTITSGEKGGLAISLYDHEGMQLLRSFGATPWLFPLLPSTLFPQVNDNQRSFFFTQDSTLAASGKAILLEGDLASAATALKLSVERKDSIQDRKDSGQEKQENAQEKKQPVAESKDSGQESKETFQERNDSAQEEKQDNVQEKKEATPGQGEAKSDGVEVPKQSQLPAAAAEAPKEESGGNLNVPAAAAAAEKKDEVALPQEKPSEAKPTGEKKEEKNCLWHMSSEAALGLAGATDQWKWWREYYLANNLFAVEEEELSKPPPIDNLVCVHGYNVETEVAYIYRQSTSNPNLKPLSLDKETKRIPTLPGHSVKEGIVYETKSSPQQANLLPPNVTCRSGDGTVPYASMAWPRVWKEKFVELDGVDHRAILRDDMVIATLLDHVCLRVVKQVRR